MKTLRNFGYFNLLAGFPLFYYSFFIGYLALLPLGVVFLVLAWAYRHRPFLRPGGQAWLGLLPALSLTLGLASASVWGERPFRQTVLVPAGYRGLVVIGYDAPHGQPEAWDEGGRLIRLSAHGTAATRFTRTDKGIISAENDKFYSLSATGQRRRLPELLDLHLSIPPSTVGVYHLIPSPEPDLLVCIVARADSLSSYLDTASYSLRPVYVRQMKTIADSLAQK
jgi:hypothetical protein